MNLWKIILLEISFHESLKLRLLACRSYDRANEPLSSVSTYRFGSFEVIPGWILE